MSKSSKSVNPSIVIPSWVAATLAELDDESLCWFMRSMLDYYRYGDFEGPAPHGAQVLYSAWYNWFAEEAEKEFLASKEIF